MKNFILSLFVIMASLSVHANRVSTTEQMALHALLQEAANIKIGGGEQTLLEFLSTTMASTDTYESVITNTCENKPEDSWRLQSCVLVINHIAKDSEQSAEVETTYFISYNVTLLGGTNASPEIQAVLDIDSVEFTFAE